MRKKIKLADPNNLNTWSKKQLISYCKSQTERVEQYAATIERRNRESNALIAEARRRTIPYFPQSGHCYINDRVEPGLTVNILPKRVVSMTMDKRRPSSSIMHARWIVEIEGEAVVNVEGKVLSPILAEIEIQKRIDEKTQDASLDHSEAGLQVALEGIKNVLLGKA